MGKISKNSKFLHPYDVWKPSLDNRVFIAPGAKIIGKVILKKDVNIWFNCILRGDVGSIKVDEGSNTPK